MRKSLAMLYDLIDINGRMFGWFFHLTIAVKVGRSIFSDKESYSS